MIISRQCLAALAISCAVVTACEDSGAVSEPDAIERTPDAAVAAIDAFVSEPDAAIPPTMVLKGDYIKASTGGALKMFGHSVAISGDTMAVGAPGERSATTTINGDETNNDEPMSGAVYVFTRNGTSWQQQAYIKASNAQGEDYFGFSVALSGDTLVVGAFQEDSDAAEIDGDQTDNSSVDAGAAYVFSRTGTTWTQQAYLKAHNSDAGDRFGISVAVDGDTVAVGAHTESSDFVGIGGTADGFNNNTASSGAVYVFKRTGETWDQEAYIKASNTGTKDRFGVSVGLSGETLVVGAHAEDSEAVGINGDETGRLASRSGAAYVFTRNGAAWSQQAYIKASNTGSEDEFGGAVAISGDTIAVGSSEEASNGVGVGGTQSNDNASDSGAVYVFTRVDGAWDQQAYIKASNAGLGDEFGSTVALAGDLLVVGAPFEDGLSVDVNGADDDSGDDTGAAYVYERKDDSWEFLAYLKASNPGVDDEFGRGVAVGAGMIVAGAPREDSIGSGVGAAQNDDSSESGALYTFLVQ